jgi:hypothetical protein
MSRKIFGLVPALLFALAACNQSTTESTADADSLAMMADTTTAEDVYGDDDMVEAEENVGSDTTLLSDIKSAFKGPQLDPKTAFVYRKTGLPVYKSLADAGNESQADGTIAFGAKVNLIDNLVNNQPSDKTIFEGFAGRYVAFKADDGSEKYIFSGYLTNFPVPKENDGLVDYFTQNFHLVGSPVKVTSKTMFETTPEWWKTKYNFEADLVIDDDGYYEGSSTSITLPGSCTMQEGFLLLRSLPDMTAFDSLFNVYPVKGFSKSIDEFRSGSVESNDKDGITKIFLQDNSGCSDETFVEKVNGRIVIGSGGGC